MIGFEHLKPIPVGVHDDALKEYKAFQGQKDHADCCPSDVCIGGFNMALRVAFEAGRKEAARKREFDHDEISFLMRSVTRSLERQRPVERETSQGVYDKLSKAFVETMDPEELKAVASALDKASGWAGR